jgi:hypothetical protein
VGETAGIRHGIQRETVDACWAAVDSFASLREAFQKKFRSDADLQYLEKRQVSPDDIGTRAAIAMHLSPLSLSPRTNIGLNWPIAVRVSTYHALGRYWEAADLIEEVVRAIFGARAPGGTATFVALATCGPPQAVTSLGITKQEFSVPLWVAEATFVFAAKTDPYYKIQG